MNFDIEMLDSKLYKTQSYSFRKTDSYLQKTLQMYNSIIKFIQQLITSHVLFITYSKPQAHFLTTKIVKWYEPLLDENSYSLKETTNIWKKRKYDKQFNSLSDFINC